MELQELRNEINRIDGEMLALLERRLAAICRKADMRLLGSGWWRC